MLYPSYSLIIFLSPKIKLKIKFKIIHRYHWYFHWMFKISVTLHIFHIIINILHPILCFTKIYVLLRCVISSPKDLLHISLCMIQTGMKLKFKNNLQEYCMKCLNMKYHKYIHNTNTRLKTKACSSHFNLDFWPEWSTKQIERWWQSPPGRLVKSVSLSHC